MLLAGRLEYFLNTDDRHGPIHNALILSHGRGCGGKIRGSVEAYMKESSEERLYVGTLNTVKKDLQVPIISLDICRQCSNHLGELVGASSKFFQAKPNLVLDACTDLIEKTGGISLEGGGLLLDAADPLLPLPLDAKVP